MATDPDAESDGSGKRSGPATVPTAVRGGHGCGRGVGRRRRAARGGPSGSSTGPSPRREHCSSSGGWPRWPRPLAGLSVPVAAVLGLRAAFRSASFAKAGNIPDARVAADDVRQWRWYVVGFGTTALIVSFLFWFFGSSGGRVRTVLFNWHYPRAHLGDLAAGFWINVKIFSGRRGHRAGLGAVRRRRPARPRAGGRPAAMAGHRLHRPVPWHPRAPRDLPRRVRLPARAACRCSRASADRHSCSGWRSSALSLTYGAYVSEVYRAGLESIHWSQTAAARSLGLSHVQTLRHVIVPQAVRRIIPPLLNDFIGLQKDTALCRSSACWTTVNRATIFARHLLQPVVHDAVAAAASSSSPSR